MPLVLENFVATAPQNSLTVARVRDAHRRLSTLLSKARMTLMALIRLAYDRAEQRRFVQRFGPLGQLSQWLVQANPFAIHHAVGNGGSACGVDDYAHVRRVGGIPKIHLGDLFFRADRSGRDSAVGTILHELSHWVANTRDHDYGFHTCQRRAARRPTLAIANSDHSMFYYESFQ